MYIHLLILILVIILVLFGAGKLPQVMQDIGKGIKNLKKGLNENEENNPLHYQSVRCSDEQLKVKPLLTWRL